jgi:hypothetical protein
MGDEYEMWEMGDLTLYPEVSVRGVGQTAAAEILDRTNIWNGINRVIKDQNAYGSMNQMLGLVGFNTTQVDGYNTKFGIPLKTKTAVAIVSQHNLTASDLLMEFSENSIVIPAQMIQDFEIEPKELDMLLLDVSPLNMDTVTIAVRANLTQVEVPLVYGTVGSCFVVSNAGEIDTNRLLPADAASRSPTSNISLVIWRVLLATVELRLSTSPGTVKFPSSAAARPNIPQTRAISVLIR